MIDLTGGNLTAYLLREVYEVMGKHPRFRSSTFGDSAVSFANNNSITVGNVSAIVKNISTQGTRLSPDYFAYIQMGRAILAKVGDKDGAFVEWVQEIDLSEMVPGVYYAAVDKVTERTQEVELSVQPYIWYLGEADNVQNMLVYLADQFNPKNVIVSDASTGYVLQPYVDYTPYLNYLIMITQVAILAIKTNAAPPQQVQDLLISEGTTLEQLLNSSPPAITQEEYDAWTPQDLIPGVNFWIQMQTANGLERFDPNSEAAYNAQNILPTTLKNGQKLASGKAITSQGDFTYDKLIVRPDGSVVLPIVLEYGGWYKYDLRISTPLIEKIIAKKQSMNNLQKVVQDQNGTELSRTNVLPGVLLAIGDNVTAGDQIAIIISPTRTECYEVYGSKENLTFALDVKANDLMTASELSELIKAEWTYRNRDNMEADGITIFEISREQTGEARDASGTATTYTYTLNVQAACDWKGFVPLVTRVTFIDVDPQLQLSYPVRVETLGTQQFVPEIV